LGGRRNQPTGKKPRPVRSRFLVMEGGGGKKVQGGTKDVYPPGRVEKNLPVRKSLVLDGKGGPKRGWRWKGLLKNVKRGARRGGKVKRGGG